MAYFFGAVDGVGTEGSGLVVLASFALRRSNADLVNASPLMSATLRTNA
jgi:hypothetical protein